MVCLLFTLGGFYVSLFVFALVVCFDWLGLLMILGLCLNLGVLLFVCFVCLFGWLNCYYLDFLFVVVVCLCSYLFGLLVRLLCVGFCL